MPLSTGTRLGPYKIVAPLLQTFPGAQSIEFVFDHKLEIEKHAEAAYKKYDDRLAGGLEINGAQTASGRSPSVSTLRR
jgi:hypothetical protein